MPGSLEGPKRTQKGSKLILLDGEWGWRPEGQEEECESPPQERPHRDSGRGELIKGELLFPAPTPCLLFLPPSALLFLSGWRSRWLLVPSLSPLCRNLGKSLYGAHESSVTPLRSPKGKRVSPHREENTTHRTFQETPAPLKPAQRAGLGSPGSPPARGGDGV